MQFRQLLQLINDRLDLSCCKFSPASLRAGGTTHYYLSGVGPDVLQFWGRWASARSMRSYIQEATAQLVWSSLAPLQQAALEARARKYEAVLKRTPRCGPRELARTVAAEPWPTC